MSSWLPANSRIHEENKEVVKGFRWRFCCPGHHSLVRIAKPFAEREGNPWGYTEEVRRKNTHVKGGIRDEKDCFSSCNLG